MRPLYEKNQFSDLVREAARRFTLPTPTPPVTRRLLGKSEIDGVSVVQYIADIGQNTDGSLHWHEGSSSFYVLEGKVTYQSEDLELVVHEGEFFEESHGTVHRVSTGETPAKLLVTIHHRVGKRMMVCLEDGSKVDL